MQGGGHVHVCGWLEWRMPAWFSVDSREQGCTWQGLGLHTTRACMQPALAWLGKLHMWLVSWLQTQALIEGLSSLCPHSGRMHVLKP